MKQKLDGLIESYRVTDGPLKSDESFGMNGAFRIPYRGYTLVVVVSDGMGWDHVSVTRVNRGAQEATIPTWDDMCFVKDRFFMPEETVFQFHPAESEYINCHPACLHLWKPQDQAIELPPGILVGPPDNVKGTPSDTG